MDHIAHHHRSRETVMAMEAKIPSMKSTSMQVLSSLLTLTLVLHPSSAFVVNGPASAQRGASLDATANYLQSLSTRPETSSASYRSSSTSRTDDRFSTRTDYRPHHQSFPSYDDLDSPQASPVTINAPPAANGVKMPSLEPLGSTRAPSDSGQRVPTFIEEDYLTTSSVQTYEKYGDVNAEELLARSSFPIKGDRLIALAKESVFLKGLGLNDGGACLAEDFTFRGSHVESKKEEFLKALESFNLGEFFVIKQQYFGWIVDPIQPNRVWFMNRQEAVHMKDFFGAKASGKKLVLPPESLHVDFNEQGQVREFGFYTVDRFQGNTGGLGGAFGYFYGVGKPLPFPEGHPYQMSKRRRIFESVGVAATKFNAYRTTTLNPTVKKCIDPVARVGATAGTQAKRIGASAGSQCVKLGASAGSQCRKIGATGMNFFAQRFRRGQSANRGMYDGR